jgi:hypothetical protein
VRTVAAFDGTMVAAIAVAGLPAAAMAAVVTLAGIVALCWVLSSTARTSHAERILHAARR